MHSHSRPPTGRAINYHLRSHPPSRRKPVGRPATRWAIRRVPLTDFRTAARPLSQRHASYRRTHSGTSAAILRAVDRRPMPRYGEPISAPLGAIWNSFDESCGLQNTLLHVE